ncbi:MAG: hypothetical protein WD226_02960 [Planctomycetota bacterium]
MHENDELHDEPNAADAQGGHGNRPADGARRATPGEVFHEGFIGSDSASDFLGLDVDMDALSQVDECRDEPLEVASPATHLELNEPAGTWGSEQQAVEASDELDLGVPDLDIEAHGQIQSQARSEPDGETFRETSTAAPRAAWDDDEHLSVEELDDEDLEDYDEEDFLDEEIVAGTGGRKLALVAIPFVLGIVAVAGVVLVPRMLEKYTDGIGAELARSVPERARTRAVVDDQPVSGANEAEPANDSESTEVVAVEFDAPEFDESAMTSEPGDAIAVDRAETRPVDDAQAIAADDPADVPTEARPGLDHLLGALVGEAQHEPRDTTWDEPLETQLWRTAPDAEWDVIWKGAAVPMEAIVSTQQVLTPRVGGVRVHLSSGEVFDGTLYAVGQNRVWLDARPGRVGFDGERVTKIDRITEEAAAASTGKRVATGDRVRIRVPGGNLFGRILAEDADGRLTVQTDAGGRVTVASVEVEAVGRSRVRVLD